MSAKEIAEFYPETGLRDRAVERGFFQDNGRDRRRPSVRLFDEMKKREEVLDRFFLLPASVGVHHVSIGGLLEHSVAVAEMGRHAAAFTGGDPDIVTAGSLLHDIGKVEEITFKAGGFGYSDQGRLLGHITLGIMILDRLVVGHRRLSRLSGRRAEAHHSEPPRRGGMGLAEEAHVHRGAGGALYRQPGRKSHGREGAYGCRHGR